jgi:hypothetical protein
LNRLDSSSIAAHRVPSPLGGERARVRGGRSTIFRGSWRVACSIRTCSPTMNQIECFSRADLFVQSQRDCAPKPGVAERARLPWVLSHTISSTPTGLCLLLFSHTATDKLWFMERFPRNEVRALNP